MKEKDEKGRKLINPYTLKKAENPYSKYDVVPKLESMFTDAQVILSAQLRSFKDKALSKVTMNAAEIRALKGLIESVVMLSREERERTRAADLTNMSDEELLQLAKELANTNKITINKSEQSKTNKEEK